MNISSKIDAEAVNREVFRANDSLKKDTVFFKSGLIILSGNGEELEKEIKHIDRISGVIDYFILKDNMKKALLYTALLKRKINQFSDKVNAAEVVLPVAD